MTFYVPDSVVHLGGTDDISHVYDSLIVARTAANMVAAGYTRILDTLLADQADLTLNPAVTVSENYDYTSGDWCDIWGWAYPWTCTGWIPDYPSDVVGYTYTTGTIFIHMADFSGGVPPDVTRPPVVWTAGINGAISGSSSSRPRRVDRRRYRPGLRPILLYPPGGDPMTPRLRLAMLLAALGMAGAAPAGAQVLGGLTYSWANPAGDLSDKFIGNDSWLGVSVEGRRFLNPNVTVGISAGYTAFYESTTEPIYFPGGTVSGEQYRSMNVFPLLVTGHLYSKAGGQDPDLHRPGGRRLLHAAVDGRGIQGRWKPPTGSWGSPRNSGSS